MPNLTMNELRETLTDVIKGVKANEITPASANAITNATGKYISTIKTEFEYMRLSGKSIDISSLMLPEEVKN